MISTTDRENAVELINEAMVNGARCFKACERLGITERTYYRWHRQVRDTGSMDDKRPTAERKPNKSKLPPEVTQQILDTCNSEKYASMPPCQIVPDLADNGIYIASESSFYRTLKEYNMLNHRGRTVPPNPKKPTTYVATGPNQVWMWDITYLNGPHKGVFFYLYLFSDLYDRSIVGWEVYEVESAEYAGELVTRICIAQGRLTIQPLVLHSDNGSPMKGATMLATLYQLGITPSNSRPRVSNDNPYAESLFKTLKYRPNYQPKGFATIEEARNWVAMFVHWYNYEHHHSGNKFLTPMQRRSPEAPTIMANRHAVYEAAKAAHPERWHGNTRNWSLPGAVTLNPDKDFKESPIEVKGSTTA